MGDRRMDYDECVQLLIKEGAENDLIIHSQMVEKLARKIGEVIEKSDGTPLKVNFETLRMGGLLHDIGRTKTHSVRHIVEGAEIARRLRFPREVVHIIETHIGSGLTPEEAEKLGLEKRSYFPQSLEAKLVAYADNLISDNRQITLDKMLGRFEGKDLHLAAERLRETHRYLSDLAGIDLTEIRI